MEADPAKGPRKADSENQLQLPKLSPLLCCGRHFTVRIKMIYIVTMAGNILIVALVVADQHLHTPMYFFLGNLSCLETCYTSTILPRMLASLLTGDRTISFSGCIIQLYSFGFLVVTECFLLAAMSYDRYLAICKPLHYAALMNGRFCLQLAAGSWISGFLAITIIIFLMLQLIFCGPNEIDHFFCDFIPLLKLSCSDTQLISMPSKPVKCIPPKCTPQEEFFCPRCHAVFLPSSPVDSDAKINNDYGSVEQCDHNELYFCGPNEIDHFLCDFTPVIKLSCSDTSMIKLATVIFSSIDTLPPFLLTLASYVCIISTILKILSTTSRQKAFSTCSSHLMMVTIFYGTVIIVYMLPDTDILRDLKKVFSVFYTVLTPLANPLIYSLRNKEVKEALRKVISKYMVLP
ncbi:Olfactory receptor 6C75 [Chelonia mydas]|uniref:Olfactory receptor 6C75 n=1 Tax=Chelonia mydas TaxID=8469 RepID=M7AK99_CHEMY|nr:Olfactory receptor 6C75 [Chelonia mydas]